MWIEGRFVLCYSTFLFDCWVDIVRCVPTFLCCVVIKLFIFLCMWNILCIFALVNFSLLVFGQTKLVTLVKIM